MTYCKIFSVINEQTVSTVTALYAISLAKACSAELVLYAAHDKSVDEAVLNQINLHLDHLFNVAIDQNITVIRIIEIGDLRKMLPRRAEMEKADLVFYPLMRNERYCAQLRRYTIHQLLKTIKSDLAIMRVITMAKPHPGHILVPLGKVVSETDRRRLFIAELARSFHGRVTLFHLSSEPEATGMPASIKAFRELLLQQNVTVLERRGRGAVGKAVTVEAITRRNDLIVLGASERGFLRRLFFGNPAGDVMHHPPCNAILFRAGLLP